MEIETESQQPPSQDEAATQGAQPEDRAEYRLGRVGWGGGEGLETQMVKERVATNDMGLLTSELMLLFIFVFVFGKQYVQYSV